jgi:hypothetical protein
MTAKPGVHPDFWGAYLTLKSCTIYVSFGLDLLPTLWQNAVQTASDCMSFDIKSITGKIYQHFHIHALHDEVLRSFGKLKETGFILSPCMLLHSILLPTHALNN